MPRRQARAAAAAADDDLGCLIQIAVTLAALTVLSWVLTGALELDSRGLLLPLLIAIALAGVAYKIGPRRLLRIARRLRRPRRAAIGARLDELMLLSDVAFEHFCGRLFEQMGYQVRVTQRSHDTGVDLELDDRRRGRGLAQCKRWIGTVGRPTLQALYGELNARRWRYAFVVTTGSFSREAILWAHETGVSLIDGRRVEELAQMHGVAALPPR